MIPHDDLIYDLDHCKAMAKHWQKVVTKDVTVRMSGGEAASEKHEQEIMQYHKDQLEYWEQKLHEVETLEALKKGKMP